MLDRDFLERRLAGGASIEAIAREVERHPSTVAYWMNRFGLESTRRARHAPKGLVTETELTELVERGLSTRQIAERLGRSQTAVRHWLQRYGLTTQASLTRGARPGSQVRECRVHGWTRFTRVGGTYRCAACGTEHVSRRRRRVKQVLIDEAGGCCAVCGYDTYAGALQFHHCDPATKEFAVGGRGLTRSIESLRAEIVKCVLLCANCHAEVEAGVTQIPLPRSAPAPG